MINHVSYLDALIMGQVFMPCGLAKSAVRRIPVVGTLACALQVCSPLTCWWLWCKVAITVALLWPCPTHRSDITPGWAKTAPFSAVQYLAATS